MTTARTRTSRTGSTAPTGCCCYGPRRPRQDLPARRNPPHRRHRRRGGRHHPAHRRLPGQRQRPADHLPGHPGPRGVHRHARPRRQASPTSQFWLSRRTTASCRRPSRRSTTPRRRTFQIIVAINKMDKPDANPERVMQQLTEYELVPEEWGGDVHLRSSIGQDRRWAFRTCWRTFCWWLRSRSLKPTRTAWPRARSSRRSSTRAADRLRPFWYRTVPSRPATA